MYYATSWLFLLALIAMLYRIRHIQDDTLIKQECSAILGIWIICQFFQYIEFSLNQTDSCYTETSPTQKHLI